MRQSEYWMQFFSLFSHFLFIDGNKKFAHFATTIDADAATAYCSKLMRIKWLKFHFISVYYYTILSRGKYLKISESEIGDMTKISVGGTMQHSIHIVRTPSFFIYLRIFDSGKDTHLHPIQLLYFYCYVFRGIDFSPNEQFGLIFQFKIKSLN